MNDTTGVIGNIGVTTSKNKIRWSIAKFDVNQSGRTIYHQNDYPTTTLFTTPLNKLDRITAELLDEHGEKLTVDSNSFITYAFNTIVPQAPVPGPVHTPTPFRNKMMIVNNNGYRR
jgi:hypothetical protein